jgi:hypothetical protein
MSNLQNLLATILRHRGYSLNTRWFDGAWFNKQIPTIDGVVLEERRGLGTPRDPQPMRCIEWNGTNQYGFQSIFPVVSFPFSLFAWARKSNTSLQSVVGISSSLSNAKHFTLLMDEGDTVGVSRANPTTIQTTQAVSALTDQWSSFVCVFNSSTSVTIFRNGVQVANLTGLTAVNLDADFDILQVAVLRRLSPTNYFAGKTMHVGLSREALTLADAEMFHETGIIPPEKGARFYTLDENSTTVSYDLIQEDDPVPSAFSFTNWVLEEIL